MDPTQQSTTPVDIDGFRAAMEAAGIEEIVDPTLSLFVEEAGKLFEEMEASWSSGDAESIRRVAHRLKSSSANVHASELSRFVADMECAAAGVDLDNASELMEAMRREYATVMEYLAERGYGS